MYIQVAQASFNYLLFGGMIGAVLGGVVGMKIFKGNSMETGE
jgi:gas vesicle protein